MADLETALVYKYFKKFECELKEVTQLVIDEIKNNSEKPTWTINFNFCLSFSSRLLKFKKSMQNPVVNAARALSADA